MFENTYQTLDNIKHELKRILGECIDRDNLIKLTTILNLIERRYDWYDNLIKIVGQVFVMILELTHKTVKDFKRNTSHEYNICADLQVLFNRLADPKSGVIHKIYNKYLEKKLGTKELIDEKIKVMICGFNLRNQIKKEEILTKTVDKKQERKRRNSYKKVKINFHDRNRFENSLNKADRF